MDKVWANLVSFFFALMSVYGSIENCANKPIGFIGGSINLTCKVAPAYEVSWGVRVGDDPVPYLMTVDSSGSNYGSQINSTSYFNRLRFFGNISAGETSFQINRLNANDSGEFMWLVDPIAGGGAKKYVLFLNVTKGELVPSTTVSTTVPTITVTVSPNPGAGNDTIPTTKPAPSPKCGTPCIIGIVCGIVALIVVIAVSIYCYKKKCS